MRVLPESLRDKLKEPLGILVNEKQLIEFLENEKYIVSIGDLVTYTILVNDIKPVFCIVDYKTRRGKCSSDIKEVLMSFGNKSITVENPAGCISDELWNIIENAYKNIHNLSLRIDVIGEEDLAALPAIYLAPGDATIIYGLPNKGVLIVKPTDENKKLVKEILDKM